MANLFEVISVIEELHVVVATVIDMTTDEEDMAAADATRVVVLLVATTKTVTEAITVVADAKETKASVVVLESTDTKAAADVTTTAQDATDVAAAIMSDETIVIEATVAHLLPVTKLPVVSLTVVVAVVATILEKTATLGDRVLGHIGHKSAGCADPTVKGFASVFVFPISRRQWLLYTLEEHDNIRRQWSTRKVEQLQFVFRFAVFPTCTRQSQSYRSGSCRRQRPSQVADTQHGCFSIPCFSQNQ